MNREDVVRLVIGLGLLILFIYLLTGCSAKQPLHNYQPGVPVRVFINPKHCHDIPEGRFACKDTVFDPQSVRVH